MAALRPQTLRLTLRLSMHVAVGRTGRGHAFSVGRKGRRCDRCILCSGFGDGMRGSGGLVGLVTSPPHAGQHSSCPALLLCREGACAVSADGTAHHWEFEREGQGRGRVACGSFIPPSVAASGAFKHVDERRVDESKAVQLHTGYWLLRGWNPADQGPARARP
eukprot:3620513-Prymnesium_polylepis.1